VAVLRTAQNFRSRWLFALALYSAQFDAKLWSMLAAAAAEKWWEVKLTGHYTPRSQCQLDVWRPRSE